MLKILFIHGLASSGAYKMADMLRQLLRPAEVLAPDLPIEPDLALSQLRQLEADFCPDLVVGLSWGGFLALRLPTRRTVVVNPDLHISRILREHIGPMKYLSPRRDGATEFLITEEACARYEALEADGTQVSWELLGCFGEQDAMVHCADEFETLFPGRAFRYPGGHLPTYPEMKFHIVPAITSRCLPCGHAPVCPD